MVLDSTDAKLLIAGEFYDDRAGHIEKITGLNLKNNVILHENFVPDDEVGWYFSAADVVALPYISATQSGVVQIAYHYDRPVVATPVGGLPEVIVQNKTGYVVSDINSKALAKGIVHLLNIKNEVDFESNIRNYKKRFSWNFMTKKIEYLVGADRYK
jgi:glycosyltransferase involved in cell wall biosynthesis